MFVSLAFAVAGIYIGNKRGDGVTTLIAVVGLILGLLMSGLIYLITRGL